MKQFFLSFFIISLSSFISFGQKKIVQDIEFAKAIFSPIKSDLFQVNPNRNSSTIDDQLKDFTLLRLDHKALRNLKSQRQPYIHLIIPQSGRNNLVLELVESELFTHDFSVVVAPQMNKVEYKHMKHYHGIIQGQEKSYAAISILDDEIMGIISHPAASGSLVIGKLANSEDHIIYQDHQIASQNPLSCHTDESDITRYNDDQLRFRKPSQRNSDKCLGMYLEVDFDIYQNKGSSVDNTIAYITSLMNQVILLYQNDQINAKISEIVVWTQLSPYNGTTSSDMLNAFRSQRSDFNGDIAQLLSFKTNGGIAYVNTLCNTNKSFRTSFSRIQSSFQNIPTYSWSVHVIAHEFGHTLGSHHTHACVWNGNNTAIDGCASTEGSCGNPGLPQQGGTIMSYCHTTQSGINFANGFGVQPGNLLRFNINSANCLRACEVNEDDNNCNDVTLKLEIKTDAYPTETSWHIKNNAGIILSSGGNYTSRHTVFNHEICLPSDCYQFEIFDKYGDGICCQYGEGHFILKRGNDVLLSGGQFNKEQKTPFCLNVNIPTCTDGIKNGNEEGVDCGGSCPACPTCTDGIKNGNEEGIDCGGSCVACPTCTDGIKNGNEEGIDCGGSCMACPTCTDGIKNGIEEGIDCGGDCKPCNINISHGKVDTLSGHFFETDWEGWSPGGSHATRIRSIHSPEGNFSLRLRNGQGELSTVNSPQLNVSKFDKISINFSFKCVGMETGKGFRLQVLKNGQWSLVKEFIISNVILNNKTYKDSIFVMDLSELTQIRFQNIGIDNGDLSYIDAIQIFGHNSSAPQPPTCDDGIQNGNEAGIDCGGSCPACPEEDDTNPTDGSPVATTDLVGYYFEQDIEGWGRGGAHASRVYSIHSPEGFYSLRLRNGQGDASAVISPLMSFENVDSLRINFEIKGVSYEEGKSIKMTYFNGTSWLELNEWKSGTDFVNNQTTTLSATILIGSSTISQIKIIGQGSDNSDLIYIDAIRYFAYHNQNESPTMQILHVHPLSNEDIKKPLLVPNPADNYVEILYSKTPNKVQIYNMSGQLLDEFNNTEQIFIGNYPPGMYMTNIHTNDKVFNLKLVKK